MPMIGQKHLCLRLGTSVQICSLKQLSFLSGAIEKLIMMDTSYDMVKLCKNIEQDVSNKTIETSFVVGDEEFLPVRERYA